MCLKLYGHISQDNEGRGVVLASSQSGLAVDANVDALIMAANLSGEILGIILENPKER